MVDRDLLEAWVPAPLPSLLRLALHLVLHPICRRGSVLLLPAVGRTRLALLLLGNYGLCLKIRVEIFDGLASTSISRVLSARPIIPPQHSFCTTFSFCFTSHCSSRRIRNMYVQYYTRRMHRLFSCCVYAIRAIP